jgi:hypothetical protein
MCSIFNLVDGLNMYLGYVNLGNLNIILIKEHLGMQQLRRPKKDGKILDLLMCVGDMS